MVNEQSKIVKTMRNAIKNGNLDVVKELLGNNDGLLEANTVFGSWLHIAASYGRIDIASYLIDCGIDVNRNGDISDGNPIRSAAENGQIEMVELLYNHGTIFDVSEAAKNPLFGAIYGGHYSSAMYAAVKKANPNWQPGQPFDPGILDSVTRESAEAHKTLPLRTARVQVWF